MVKLARWITLSIFLFALTGCVTRTIVVRTPPPPPKEEVRPSAPYSNAVWVSGHWKYTRHNYVWVPGHWKKVPRGWKWVPGHWK
ncbi:YXWGXW repeat-containing protein [candidate division WOR-3 bacterium]|nr:YXWGXW repeat-containing protein [candidate division WOR-3 bacterium]